MNLGSLVVSLTANIAQFTSDMGRAAHISEKSMEQMKRSAANMGRAVGVAIGEAATTFGYFLKHAIDVQEQMNKNSQAIGMAVADYSALSFAAQMADQSNESLTQGLKKLAVNAVDTARGTGDAKDAFAALGISVLDANGKIKSQDQMLMEIADKFARYEDGAAKTALAVKIFGRAGAEMIPLLNGGSAAIKEAKEEARALGVVLDTDTAKAADNFNDNLDRLKAAQTGIANSILRQMLPALGNLSDQLVTAAKSAGALDKAAAGAVAGLKLVMSAGAIITGIFKVLGTYIGGFAASIYMMFQGRFKDAWDIATSVVQDAGATIRGTIETIDTVWNSTSWKVEGKAADTGKKIAAPLLAANKHVKAEKDVLGNMLDGIKKKYEELGMTAEQIDIFRATNLGATESQLELVRAMHAVIRAAEEQQKKLGESSSIYTETRTPAETLGNTLSRLQELLDAGVISWDTYTRAVFNAQDAYDKATSSGEKAEESVNEFAKNAAKNFQDSLADFLFDPFDKGLQGMLDGFANLVRRMIAEAAAADLARALFGSAVKGGTGSGILGSVLGSIGSWFSGGKANGGAVSARRAYLVGERGPELFVPGGNGTIMPNGGGSASAPQSIQVSIHNEGRPQEVVSAVPRFDPQGMVIDILTRDLKVNGPITQSMSQTFGVSRMGGR